MAVIISDAGGFEVGTVIPFIHVRKLKHKKAHSRK